MKLKSLLLGSAAVLVAVSGARAADAIVIEPEPVEYVRVCDAYGAGFFYIPGTETCLRISGYVRVNYATAHFHQDNNFDDTSSHEAQFRARLQFDARNETEYGTLRSFIRIQGTGGDSILFPQVVPAGQPHNDVLSLAEGPKDPGVALDKAYIQLGGFTVGYHDNYWSRGLRYGYYRVDRYDFANYGYSDALLLDYTYSANGWTFSVGAEDADVSGEAGAPDMYVGFTYSGSGWFFGGTVYHDSSADAQAYRVRMDYDFGNGFAFGGWYSSDDGNTDYVKGHQWGVTASYALSDSMVLWAGYQQDEDNYFDNTSVGVCDATGIAKGNAGCGVDTSEASWTVGLDWDIVPGLSMQTTYSAVWEERSVRNRGVWGVQLTRSF